MVPSGYQISRTGGHGDDLGWPPGVFETGPEQGVADGRAALLRAVAWVNTGGGVDLTGRPPEVVAKGRQISAQAKTSLRLAIREGVPIAYGTDAGVYPHGLNANDFPVLVDAGKSPVEAIRSATLHAADLLGVDDRGALEPGLLADVIAVPGNPLDDVTALQKVTFVMQGGKVFRDGLLRGDAGGIPLELLTQE